MVRTPSPKRPPSYVASRPNLLETLMQVVYTEFPKRSSMTEENPAAALRLRRALRLIYKVVKQFYSQRLLAGVRVMASVRTLPPFSILTPR